MWKLRGDRADIVRNQGIEADEIAKDPIEWERKIAG